MSNLALTAPKPATTNKPQFADVAAPARGLARDIGKNVVRILGALQIGDITRQRAEHVRAGLALLDSLDRSANQLRLRAAGEMLLAAQFEAALQDYNQEVAKLIPSIEGLASGALALAALSDIVTELGDSDHDLRDLKSRIDTAVQLIAEIQAADGAARYLAGRLIYDKGAHDQGTIPGAAQPDSERHPLYQKASDLLDRVVYLEAASDDCVVILERLKAASEALIADRPATAQTPLLSLESPKEMAAAAAERIMAILEKAEDDMAAHAGKNSDILGALDRAADPATSYDLSGELEPGGDTGLKFTFPDPGHKDDAFSGDLSVLLSRIERLYAMGQERDVHRAFSKACGLDVAEDTDTLDDGLF